VCKRERKQEKNKLTLVDFIRVFMFQKMKCLFVLSKCKHDILFMFHFCALKEYLTCTTQPTDTHVSNTFCHTLLTTNLFRSLLLSSSSGQLYSSTNNTTNHQIMSVEPLKDTINVSNSPYGHRMSADVLFDTGKM
jgi:hypothetical protein